MRLCGKCEVKMQRSRDMEEEEVGVSEVQYSMIHDQMSLLLHGEPPG